MGATRRWAPVLLALVLGVAVAAGGGEDRAQRPTVGWTYRLSAEEAQRDGARLLTAERRAAGFEFAPSVAPAERARFHAAIGDLTQDARRLLDLVDGLVEVRFGTDPDGALGRAFLEPDGRHAVLLDLAAIRRHIGLDGLREVALHELGHIVDYALVPDAVKADLDAQIPPGFTCPEHTRRSACAPREERFADTFVKWATGGRMTFLMRAGYAVLPPSTGLSAWGAPLSELARR